MVNKFLSFDTYGFISQEIGCMRFSNDDIFYSACLLHHNCVIHSNSLRIKM